LQIFGYLLTAPPGTFGNIGTDAVRGIYHLLANGILAKRFPHTAAAQTRSAFSSAKDKYEDYKPSFAHRLPPHIFFFGSWK
jgi:hypothetical protein